MSCSLDIATIALSVIPVCVASIVLSKAEFTGLTTMLQGLTSCSASMEVMACYECCSPIENVCMPLDPEESDMVHNHDDDSDADFEVSTEVFATACKTALV